MEINDKTTSYPIGGPLSKPNFEATERAEKKETQDEQNTEASEAGDQHAVVSISRASREAQLIKEILESEEAVVREERVSDLKEKVDSGRYSVDSEKVANKLVDDWLDDVF